MIQSFAIINKRGEVLYSTKFDCTIPHEDFKDFLEELLPCTYGDPPPYFVTHGKEYAYIFRDELYWCCLVEPRSFISKCGPLAVIENLNHIHHICLSMCGSLTQNSLFMNCSVIQEIVMEVMRGGYIQIQTPEKLQNHIYSQVENPGETSALNFSPGLFGMEKSSPRRAPYKSLLVPDTGKKEVYIDVVEKIWATISPSGVPLRAEVLGSINMHCFLPNSILCLTLNSNLDTTPKEGFHPKVQVAEVDFSPMVDTTHLLKSRELRVTAQCGESNILNYSLPSTLPHELPFTLSFTKKQLTHSDTEIKLKLSSTTGMATVSPHVLVKIVVPPSTATIMSRTSGPKNQTVSFAPKDKLVEWNVKDFPGSSYAQTFIRLVDSGENCNFESAQMEFEVSQWLSSGLRIENVKLLSSTTCANKWVRYLTVSDTVTFML